jgi:uncharacterized membrane protein
VLDLVFLVGVLVKGLDGLAELAGGAALLMVSPLRLAHVARTVTAGELARDPHDVVANLVLHTATHLGAQDARFLALYLLLHGVVKVAIVGALVLGSRRVYPWAIGALTAFLVYQVYVLATAPTMGIAVLAVLDAVIVALTWREWRHGRTLHSTARATLAWVLRRPARAIPGT